MQKYKYITFACFFTLSASFGCITTQDIKRKIASHKSTVDEGLFKRVSEDHRGGLEKAELKLLISKEKVYLADLRKNLAIAKKTVTDHKQSLADIRHQQAQVNLDIVKWKAIDRARLGERKKRIESITDLQAKKLELEADEVRINAKVITAKEIAEKREKQWEEQRNNVRIMSKP